LSSSEPQTQALGGSTPWWAEKRNEETRAAIRTQLDEVAFAAARAEGWALPLDEAVALALW